MKGVWFWPSVAKEQEKVLRKIMASESLLAALTALSKSKDGLSNAQLDITINSFSQWNTHWTIEQLISLGFAEYKIEWFGDAGKYALTELGKDVLSRLTGQSQQQAVAQVQVPKPGHLNLVLFAGIPARFNGRMKAKHHSRSDPASFSWR